MEVVPAVASCSCADLEELVVPSVVQETCTYPNCTEDHEDSTEDTDGDSPFVRVDRCCLPS